MTELKANSDIADNTTKGLKSKVWGFFGFPKKGDQMDQNKTVCKLCLTTIAYKGQTSNMSAHLTKYHFHQYMGGSPRSSTTTRASGSNMVQGTLKGILQQTKPYPVGSLRLEAINKAIAMFLTVDLKPISVIDGSGFKHFLKVLDPRYQPISRPHLTDNYIWPLYHETKLQVQDDINRAVRHAVTTDGWQSSTCDSYNTTTCHYIDPVTCTLESHALDTKKWEESHTAENLANVLISTNIKWNLKEPVIVHDNAANITKAAVITGFDELGCFAHVLNLGVTKGTAIPEVQSLLGRCRKLVSIFKYSGQKKVKLMNSAAELQIKVY